MAQHNRQPYSVVARLHFKCMLLNSWIASVALGQVAPWVEPDGSQVMAPQTYQLVLDYKNHTTTHYFDSAGNYRPIAVVDDASVSHVNLNLTVVSLQLKWAPVPDFEFGVTFPFTLHNISLDDPEMDLVFAPASGRGFGDIRWSAKYQLLNPAYESPWRLSSMLQFVATHPTGRESTGRDDVGHIAVTGEGISETELSIWGAISNSKMSLSLGGGTMLRPKTHVQWLTESDTSAQVNLGDSIFATLQAKISILEGFLGITSLEWQRSYSSTFTKRNAESNVNVKQTILNSSGESIKISPKLRIYLGDSVFMEAYANIFVSAKNNQKFSQSVETRCTKVDEGAECRNPDAAQLHLAERFGIYENALNAFSGAGQPLFGLKLEWWGIRMGVEL